MMNYRRRMEGLGERLAREHLRAAAYGPSADFQYLTGLAMGWRDAPDEPRAEALLLAGPGAAAVLLVAGAAPEEIPNPLLGDVRVVGQAADFAAAVREALADVACGDGPVAAAGRMAPSTADAFRAANAGADAPDAAGLLDDLRLVKDAGEIDRLRRVGRLTDEVFAAVLPHIREGVTQGDLEAEIARQGRRLGAEGVSFPPAAVFTKSGSPPAAEPFVYPREQGLVAGTSIGFDFGFVLEGYCSDFGRSVYLGPVPGHIAGAYAALQQAVVELVGAMAPGRLRFCDLFGLVERSLDEAGYGRYLRARLPNGVLGHNIGIAVHEEPWARPGCDRALEAGMVLAVEPKLWHAGEYYLRVEDMVLVGAAGAEFLTRFDRALFAV